MARTLVSALLTTKFELYNMKQVLYKDIARSANLEDLIHEVHERWSDVSEDGIRALVQRELHNR